MIGCASSLPGRWARLWLTTRPSRGEEDVRASIPAPVVPNGRPGGRNLPQGADHDFGRRLHHLPFMNELTIWYDGTCPLCRREIALMRRLDRRGAIRFIDAANGEAAACPIDRGDLLARFHAWEGGRLVSGAEAFAAMWRAIPLLRPLGLAARSPVALALLERAYRAFLRVRPTLQRFAHRLERS